MTKILMDEKTKHWVRKNGGTVALYPFYPLNPNKGKGPIDVMVMLERPENMQEMTVTMIDELEVYVHRDIQAKRSLKIHRTGYGPFQHLCCSGMKRFKKQLPA